MQLCTVWLLFSSADEVPTPQRGAVCPPTLQTSTLDPLGKLNGNHVVYTAVLF